MPLRLDVKRTDDLVGFANNTFFGLENPPDTLTDRRDTSSNTGIISTLETPALDINGLLQEIIQFGRLPAQKKDQDFLDFVISRGADCDEFCTQCTTFGYEPGSGGCLIHRSLGFALAQHRNGSWSVDKAKSLCKGIIADAAATFQMGQAPLASLLRLAIDIVWISAREGDMEAVTHLATDILDIPLKFLNEKQYSVSKPGYAMSAPCQSDFVLKSRR